MSKDILKAIIMYTIVLMFIIAISFQACDHLLDKAGLEHDSILEEAVENVIEKETGIKIDLSITSPED